MGRIFISYATEDLGSVEIIQEILEPAYECYIAERDVKPGGPITGKVESAISTSDAFVVLISEDSVKSPWVNQEIGYARGRALGHNYSGDTERA